MSAADLSTTAATGARQMLRLACGSEHLVVPIDVVREILEVGRLTAMPQTPSFVRGVMNLRGAVMPVIDLGARFGFGRSAIGRRSAIVVVEVADDADRPPLVLGLLVDAVFEVLDVEGNRVEAVPSLGMVVPPQFVSGMVNVRDRYTALLNLAAALSPVELTKLMVQA